MALWKVRINLVLAAQTTSSLLQLKTAKIRHCAASSGERSTYIRVYARLAFILNLFAHCLSFVWFQLQQTTSWTAIVSRGHVAALLPR